MDAAGFGRRLPETIRALRPDLPDFLSGRALAWCERVAEDVPDSARSHYLECRPGQNERIDLLTFFGAKDAYAGYQNVLAKRAALHKSSAWGRSLELLREWSRPGSELSCAPCVWFEYDAPASFDSEGAEASPSVGLESDYQQRHHLVRPGLDPLAKGLSAATLDLLLPATDARAMRSAVELCLAALPPEGSAGYLSVMTARKPVVAKLYVILPRALMLPYLRAIAWPGDTARALDQLNRLYLPELRTVYLDLSLQPHVAERLGIALSQFNRGERAATSAAAWPPLPAALAFSAKALGAWPGVTRAVLDGSRYVIRRWLDLKVVMDGPQVEYKAYLGFAPTLPPPFE
jgi:hypothetical protein